MEIHFSKLQESGADFIVIDEFHRLVIPDELKGQFAASYCDRRYGIGAEGVIFLTKSARDDLRMRIFRPDGTEDGGGNGIRCLARFAADAGYIKGSCRVETPAGSIGVALDSTEEGFLATVMMNPPQFDRKEIPATGTGEYQEQIGGFDVYAVNTGVPHAVIIVEDPDAVDAAGTAPAIMHHATFPEGANVNFAGKTGDSSIRVRTFERNGENETLSSSTGATASAAVMHRLGLVGDIVEAATQGGPLTIYLKGVTKMEGPAETVFTGSIRF